MINLTPREHEIVKLVAAGQVTKVIARKLGCSPSTIKTHLLRIRERAGLLQFRPREAAIRVWHTRSDNGQGI